MSKITDAFNHGKAFIPFITCGYPDLETTAKTIIAMSENGADIIELGIPFSDPTAEGPVITAADEKALEKGITTDIIFDFVEKIRAKVKTPFVFMTYANVVFSYGTERFVKKCVRCGVDGLILPDVPYEEKHEFSDVCKEYNIDFISLVAPTSEKRIEMISKEAEGFIYVVSSLGVTGVRNDISTDIKSMTDIIKNSTDIPCAVGFGISTPEQAREMSRDADGVIVGSAIIKLIAKYGMESALPVGEYVKKMKDAL